MQRSDAVASYPGWFQCAGSGHPEPDSCLLEDEDELQPSDSAAVLGELFDSAANETRDEAGVPLNTLSPCLLIGIVEDDALHGKPDLVFTSSTSLTAAEVLELYNSAPEGGEGDGDGDSAVGPNSPVVAEKFESVKLIPLDCEKLISTATAKGVLVDAAAETLLGAPLTPVTRGALLMWARHCAYKERATRQEMTGLSIESIKKEWLRVEAGDFACCCLDGGPDVNRARSWCKSSRPVAPMTDADELCLLAEEHLGDIKGLAAMLADPSPAAAASGWPAEEPFESLESLRRGLEHLRSLIMSDEEKPASAEVMSAALSAVRDGELGA